ncbi:MAG TPA: hydrolase 2, exosortase A system-associated, partial [Azonexus sp.]
MQPDFLTVHGGQRFCLFHPAQDGVAKGAVLYLHPFAEEMNKARRMAALQSRALAAAGYDVLQFDLLGCGDSSGDFADATWPAWREDVLAGYRHLRS